MKFSLVILASVIGALAAPTEESGVQGLEVRGDNCFHPSSCSATWGGKCEDYCGSRKFSHMTKGDCGLFKKKCCCVRK